MFKKRENIFEVEEGKFLSPKFDVNGLISVTTTDSSSGDLLMHGFMNEEALKKTIETKEAHYWSRSRKALWHKGKTSGFVQKSNRIKN
jgi:phosphoribosyl-AMP cyclohydrolase